jgi:chromosome partitioning protein
MQTIAVCHQKGGVSKSTIVMGLAVELSGLVAIYDGDSQGSCAKWLERRDSDTPLSFSGPPKKLPEIKQKAKDMKVDWLIIDTPPSHDDEIPIRSAIAAADFVILPTKMGRFDLEVLPKTAKISNALNKPWMSVLTMAHRSKMLDHAIKNIKLVSEELGGKFCPTILMNRVAHVESSFYGKTVSEFESGGLAAYEIRKIKEAVVFEMEKNNE